MKYLNFPIFLAIIIVSCSNDDSNRDCRKVEYNTNIELQLNDEICFPDGNLLTFSDIEHQFCPCGTTCIWAGDLYITFSASSDSETKTKSFYPSKLEDDRSIFNSHKITSLTYSYGDDNEVVPDCAEDFKSEKVTLTLTISSL